MAQDTRRRRVGAELHRLLSDLLRTEVKDPRLEDVTVSEVEMSGDLGVARIYYSTLDPEASIDDADEGFRKASGFLRGRIGRALHLRRAPELHFVRDDSARRGAELTRLIDSVLPPRSEEHSDAPEDGHAGEGGDAGEDGNAAEDGDAAEDDAGAPRPDPDADER